MSYIADENSFLKRAHDTRNTAETRAFYNRWAETYDADLIEENDYVSRAAVRKCCRAFCRTARPKSSISAAAPGCPAPLCLKPAIESSTAATLPPACWPRRLREASIAGCSRPT